MEESRHPKPGKFISPWGVRFPMLGRGATQASFPYHVIGKGKVDLYWSLGEAIQVANASYIGLRIDQYRLIQRPLLVEMSSYIGVHRASLIGASLRRDGVLAHLWLLSGFQKE